MLCEFRMRDEEHNTRSLLIETAGKLFAENGLEGTSVRAIAEKAGANIAAVNYYFGSKENLYREVLMFVAKRGETYPALHLLENPDILCSKEGKAEAIRRIVYEKFKVIFARGTPEWYWKLMIRSMLDASNPAVEAVVRKVFEPEHRAIIQIVQAIKPDVDEQTAHMWGFLLFGAVSFYVFAKTPILLLMGKDEYSEYFIDAAAQFVTDALLAAFDLK